MAAKVILMSEQSLPFPLRLFLRRVLSLFVFHPFVPFFFLRWTFHSTRTLPWALRSKAAPTKPTTTTTATAAAAAAGSVARRPLGTTAVA